MDFAHHGTVGQFLTSKVIIIIIIFTALFTANNSFSSYFLNEI